MEDMERGEKEEGREKGKRVRDMEEMGRGEMEEGREKGKRVR